ncbi:hypothetical protein ABPG74_018347 [Tetrahymena malaccensis]
MMQEIELKYRDKIRKLNILLFNPPIRSPSKAQLIIIRHAFSEINLKMKEFLTEKFDEVKENKNHPERKQIILSREDIDSPLHEIGILQCINNQKHINLIDFSIVLVSPLKRALQTCIYLFQTHPNRKEIKFLVFPQAAEKLSNTSSFSPDTFTSQKEEISQLASRFEIEFDYSLFNEFEIQEQWQIEMLCNDHFHMKQKLKESDLNKINYKEFVLQEFDDHFPEYLETWEQLYERAIQAKIQIKEFLRSTDKKVGLISHFNLIKCLTGDGVNDEKQIINGININNCQIIPYPNIKKDN